MNMLENNKKMESNKIQKKLVLYEYDIEKEVKKELRLKQKKTINIILYMLAPILFSSIILITIYSVREDPSSHFLSPRSFLLIFIIAVILAFMVEISQIIVGLYYDRKFTRRHIFLRNYLKIVFYNVLESSSLNPKTYKQQEKNK
ncbi:hypothetical protein ES703_66164 [subsurface metagenome]